MSDFAQILTAITEIGDRLDARIEKLDGRMDKLDARMDKLEQQITQLRVDVMGRLDRQQDLLTSVQNDIGVNMAALGRSRELSKGYQDEVHALASQVSLVHRRLIALEQRVESRDQHP